MKTINVPDSYVLTPDDEKILAKRAKKKGEKIEELKFAYVAEKNIKNATKLMLEFELALNSLNLKLIPKLQLDLDSIQAIASLVSLPSEVMKADKGRIEGGIQALSTVPNLIKKT